VKTRWMITPAALIAMAVAAFAAVRLLAPSALPDGFLYGNGHIEGTDIRISAEIPARVLSVQAEEGRTVKTGDVLATLDDADLRTQLERANAEVRAAEQQRASIEREISTSQHHLSTATENLERARKLVGQDIGTQQQSDAAEDRFEEARGRVDTLQSALAQADAQLEAATKSVDLVEVQLGKTVVQAPLEATVLVKAVEVGEFVTPGQPIATLVDLTKVKLKVYIPESEIGKIKLGDPAKVRIDAFPERYFEATVAQVDQQAQFTPKDIHVPAERTRMVFGVELSLKNDEHLLKPGMPADAWIRWQTDVSWPESLPVPQR